jgi:hypothetical protein
MHHTQAAMFCLQTSRSNNFMGTLSGSDRYGIVIQPGVDMVFVLTVCNAIDDMTFA